MTELDEMSEELRLFFSCSEFSTNTEGVSVTPISDKKHAIGLKMKDGSLFGITVEKLK